MENELLTAAREAFEKNDLPTARSFFRAFVTRHPADEEGWLWMSRVTENVSERNRCLKRVLELNPTNRVAMGGLLLLSQKQKLAARPAKRSEGAKSAWRKWNRVAGWLLFGLAALVLLLVAAATIPMFMGYRSLVIMSGSMEPAIHTGAVVIAAPVPSKELQKGDVIIFATGPDAPVPIVHRIVSIHQKDGVRYFITRGDANKATDTAEISLPPTGWRVAYNLPMIGYLISWITSPVGTVMLIVIPLVGLVALSALDWLKRTRPARAFA